VFWSSVDESRKGPELRFQKITFYTRACQWRSRAFLIWQSRDLAGWPVKLLDWKAGRIRISKRFPHCKWNYRTFQTGDEQSAFARSLRDWSESDIFMFYRMTSAVFKMTFCKLGSALADDSKRRERAFARKGRRTGSQKIRASFLIWNILCFIK